MVGSGYPGEIWKSRILLGWQDWSAFGETTVSVRSTNTTSFEEDRNFKDTWHAADQLLRIEA